MKNLFVLTEEEKNRILGLHESATKNHYLINEQTSEGDAFKVADSIGLGKKEILENRCVEIMIFDGPQYDNLICNVCPNGYIDFKVENDYKNKIVTGSWSTDQKTITIKMSDGREFRGKFNQSNSLKTQIQEWLTTVKVFNEWISVRGRDGEIVRTWDSWKTTKKSSEDVIYKQNSELKKFKENYPCITEYPLAEVVYYGNNKEKVAYVVGDYWYYNDGTKVSPDGTKSSWSCQDKIFLQTVQPKPEPVVSGGQENPNVTRIKDLQTKVGVKDDGILGPKTLKAIMDKLSQ
jgi:hypothetical protein